MCDFLKTGTNVDYEYRMKERLKRAFSPYWIPLLLQKVMIAAKGRLSGFGRRPFSKAAAGTSIKPGFNKSSNTEGVKGRLLNDIRDQNIYSLPVVWLSPGRRR